MRLIILSSQLFALLITILECDARSTRVTAQYTVADSGENSQRTFRGKGIVEDASINDDAIFTKFSPRPTRNSPRGASHSNKKKVTAAPTQDYEHVNYQQEQQQQQLYQLPDIFAVKGKVFDDETVPTRSTQRTRATHRTRPTGTAKVHSLPVSQYRFPSIKSEEIFESKLQEAPTTIHTKNFKPDELESTYSYSTIKFSDDNDDSDTKLYPKKLKAKPPKRSPLQPAAASSYNLEQEFGGQAQQTKFNTAIDHGEASSAFDENSFKPSTPFALPSTTKRQKSPPKKLFKSPDDEFKDSEYYDFSIRPRPGISSSSLASSPLPSKFSSDLGVKQLAIKPHKNKFDPPQVQNGGFQPSFKLKDFPNLHGGDIGHGIASPGQIKTFYEAAESERDERIKLKLSSDPNPASKGQLAQFYRAKEDERLEKLVEEQFKLHQQKQLQHEKEAELKHQQLLLHRQKEKLKQAEKQFTSKVNLQNTRHKRRPPHHNNGAATTATQVISSSRRQRNPLPPINFSVTGSGAKMPVRTIKSKDGSYRVSFNIQ